jgi:vacuolar-type H+-ATPase subunit H
MSLFSRKDGQKDGGFTAPTFDPYERYKNTGSGIFGFRKDNHVVLPGVTMHEEFKLKKVKDYVQKETGKPCTLSQELINDVYSIYVNNDIKRRPANEDNTIRHKVLDKVYDSLTKIVTVDSPLFTQILTRELAMALQIVDDEVKEKQQEQKGEGDGDGDGESQGLETPTGGDGEGEGEDNDGDSGKGASKDSGSSNRKSIEDIVDKALDNAKNNIDKAKAKADEKIKDLEDQLGKEAMKDLMNADPEFLEKMDELKHKLKAVSINKDSIKKVMEKILNESQNYFSTKFKRVEESLFDCEECEDLFGLEFLHPVFKNAEIMSVGNETRIYKGKMDLYLDCSGSMDSQENFEGTNIRMIDLAKGIAMVLFRMGMIENLYFFDGGLYEIKNVNEITILSFSKSGGTNFNNVVNKIKENGNNSVIITDGFDGCQEYSKQAFWIGIGGTTFDSYGDSAFNTYRSNRQCVAYDSSSSKFNYCNQESR